MYTSVSISKFYYVLLIITQAFILTLGTYGLLSVLEGDFWQYMDLPISISIGILFIITLILSLFLVRYDVKHRVMTTLKTEKRILAFTSPHKTIEVEAFQFFKVSITSLFYLLTPYRRLNLYFKGVKSTQILSLIIPKDEILETRAQLRDFYHIKD